MDNPAAWHPDPAGKHDHRWWDGQRWTEHVADAGVAAIDPLPEAPDASATEAATADPAGDGGAGAAGAGAAGAVPGTDGHTSGTDATPPAAEQPAWGQQPTAEQPVWGQQPTTEQPAWGQQQQPGGSQAPWGGAPAAAPAWGQSWDTGSGSSGSNGLAVGALITGILSLPLLLLFGIGVLPGIVAVVLGIVALRRIKRGEASGRGMAIGGIVTGALAVVLFIIGMILLVTFGVDVAREMDACLEETGGDDAECQRRLEDELTDRFLGD